MPDFQKMGSGPSERHPPCVHLWFSLIFPCHCYRLLMYWYPRADQLMYCIVMLSYCAVYLHILFSVIRTKPSHAAREISVTTAIFIHINSPLLLIRLTHMTHYDCYLPKHITVINYKNTMHWWLIYYYTSTNMNVLYFRAYHACI